MGDFGVNFAQIFLLGYRLVNLLMGDAKLISHFHSNDTLTQSSISNDDSLFFRICIPCAPAI
jgi:hypothetical protein